MSDSEFDFGIKTIQDQQKAADPLTQAKRQLAPLRAEAEQLRKDWAILLASLMPGINSAAAQQHAAAQVGVYNPSLNDSLKQIGDLILNGDNGFKEFIERCEGLTLFQATQANYMRTLPGVLNSYKAVFGALKSLVAALDSHVFVLSGLVADAAARPAPTMGPQDGTDIREVAAAQAPSRPDGPGL